jgi:hypothetical protein
MLLVSHFNTEERIVNTIEPGKTFVRFRPEGAHGDQFLAFVAGIFGQHEDELLLCLINRKGVVEAPRRLCTLVPPTSLLGGVIGFIAREPTFGVGEVVSEERIDGMLYLDLFRDEEYSGLVPVTDLTFCCPSSS